MSLTSRFTQELTKRYPSRARGRFTPHRLGIVLLLTAGLLFQLGCSTTQLPSFSMAQSPHLLEDEAVLWSVAQEEEDHLLASDLVYDDPDFDQYTTAIIDDLVGPTARFDPEYRVRLIQDPAPNAFAYPHGSIYLSTGLLAELKTEAQLAMVLAHEVSHVQQRHAIRQQRQRKNKTVGITVVSAVAIAALLIAEVDAADDGHWARAESYGFFGDLFFEIGDEALHFCRGSLDQWLWPPSRTRGRRGFLALTESSGLRRVSGHLTVWSAR